jgi:histidinol-phosphate phosphatase family protein
MSARGKRRAVFLDRDGTINREVDVLRRLKQLRLLPNVSRAIRDLNRFGYLVVVITNQPVVARGWITEKYLREIHGDLTRRLARSGAWIDAIYYCPHHPNANLKKYRMACSCRKPEIGMIKNAAKDLNIKLDRNSFFVGDSSRDMLAGKRAKLTTILVKTGYAGADGKYDAKPDYVAKNLLAAVGIIKRHGK